MFNIYTHLKKEDKEPETTGHDRFYEERPRASYKKKKREACRRAQSEAQLNLESIAAANKRKVFTIRSASTEREDSEAEEERERAPLVTQKIDSIAKILFNKSVISSPGSSSKSSPSNEAAPYTGMTENTVLSAAAAELCSEYLSYTTRYELISYLKDIGSRPDRHWFAIRDNSIKTERLLTLVPLGSRCPIEPGERSRGLILELFRALQHPYIYPVLDVAFCGRHLLAVVPFNALGSLKDLIYKSSWNDEWGKKYAGTGTGLPALQVGRIGRQLLEALLFLNERRFPPFRHLHTGNVILQNGVARISGLENTLVFARTSNVMLRCEIHCTDRCVEVISLGRVLHEMCCGCELYDTGNIQLQLEKYPQVLEVEEYIFGSRSPGLRELLMFDLFRKIDLREMKGSCLPNFNQRVSRSCMSLLEEVGRRQGAPPIVSPLPARRHAPLSDRETQDGWQL